MSIYFRTMVVSVSANCHMHVISIVLYRLLIFEQYIFSLPYPNDHPVILIHDLSNQSKWFTGGALSDQELSLPGARLARLDSMFKNAMISSIRLILCFDFKLVFTLGRKTDFKSLKRFNLLDFISKETWPLYVKLIRGNSINLPRKKISFIKF